MIVPDVLTDKLPISLIDLLLVIVVYKRCSGRSRVVVSGGFDPVEGEKNIFSLMHDKPPWIIFHKINSNTSLGRSRLPTKNSLSFFCGRFEPLSAPHSAKNTIFNEGRNKSM